MEERLHCLFLIGEPVLPVQRSNREVLCQSRCEEADASGVLRHIICVINPITTAHGIC